MSMTGFYDVHNLWNKYYRLWL